MNIFKNFQKNSRQAIGILSIAFLFFNNTVKAQALDAGLTVFSAPLGAAHTGATKLLKVTVRNYGNATISSVKVGWKINGVDQLDVTQALSLPAASNTLQISSGTITISSNYVDNLNNTVVAYVKEINNTTADINPLNDTVTATFGSPLTGGVKTIGNIGADYSSISAAINALNYNGLSANITFKIKPGSYTDNIDLDALNVYQPNGAKNITFESFSGKRDVILISEAAQQVSVKLNGIDKFTLNNIRVVNRNIVTGIGVQLTNGANNCTIKNCEITVDSISNSKGFAGILAANMGTQAANYPLTAPATGTAKYLSLKYNKISGGYYGIALVGSTSPRDTASAVDSNIIQQTSFYGVFVNFSTNAKIRGNKVYFRPSADVKSAGYWLTNITTAAPGNIEIVRNYVTDAGQYGIYMSSVVGTGAPTNRYVNINNNMISGGFYNNYSNAANTFNATETPVGLYLNSVGWANIFFNSILMDAPTKTGTVDNTTTLYINGSPATGSLYVYNNILYNANKGYAYYNASATNSVIASDNNDIFVALLDTNANNATGYAWYGGVPRVKPSELQIASNRDKNSLSIDPLFFSNSDLHTLSPDLNQKGSSATLSQAQFDFDGEVRDGIYNANAPDIGCDEYGPGGNDYAIIGVTPDVFKYKKPTPWNITVRWQGQNNGSKTLFFKYKIDGVDQLDEDSVIQLNFNRLTANFKTQTLPVKPWQFITRNNYQPFKLTVYFLAGSNLGDLRLINDSITVDVCVGLEGLFTIDPKASINDSTFNSFQEVYDYLKCGVSGPTVIQIADGTYDEQINLWKIRNSSAINTITFKSKNNVLATKLTYANGTAENHSTVLFNNAQYITLRDLTIESRSISNGSCVQFAGNSKFNTLKNNIIKIDSTQTTYPTTLACIVATKLGNLFNAPYAANANNNLITGNKIFGGYYGIAMYGSDTDKRDLGNIIEANTITSFHRYGVYLEYADTRVIRNVITGKFGMDNNAIGIYAKGLGDRAGVYSNEFSGNKIYDVAYQGIQLFQCLGNKNLGAKKSTFVLSNNMIGGGFTTFNTATSGIFLNSCLAISILHNTIYMDAPRATTGSAIEQNPSQPRCLIVNSSNTDVEALNNILYSRNGAIPLDYYTASGNTVPNGLIVSENNLYYTWYSNKNTPLILIRRQRKTQQNTTITSYGFSQLSETPLSALTKFKNATGNGSRDRKSLGLPVMFESLPYNFHTYDLTVESKAAGGQDIIDDIDKDSRKTKTPDIGCDEFTVPNYDLDVNKIRNPLLSALKPNYIQVELRNRGKYSLDKIKVVLRCKVEDVENGFSSVSQDTVTLTMKKTGDIQIYKFKTGVSVPRRGYYDVCVEKFSGLNLDTVYTNDKKCVNICTGIEGNFYIGFNKNYLPGTDTTRYYDKIQEAFDNVYCGIADDTWFNVKPSATSYRERLLIPKYLVNLDSPLLTLQPYNTQLNSEVVIEQPLTPVGDNAKVHYTVRFNGSNFVKLLNLTIRNSGLNFGTGVHFTKNANSNIVERCNVVVNTTATTQFFYPIIFSSSNKIDINDVQSNSKSGHDNRVLNNTLVGGYAGAALLGASVIDLDYNNSIDSNTISDYYQCGIYSINNTIKSISFNKLTPRAVSAPSCISISYKFAGEGGIINANRLINSKQIGINLYGIDAFMTNRLIVSNNWITHNFGTTIADTASAILIKRSSNIGLYYNSIRYNGFVSAINVAKETIQVVDLETGLTTTQDITPTNINFVNNLVQVDSVVGYLKKPYVIYFNSTDPTSEFEHNSYWTGYQTRFAYYKTSADQKSLGIWSQNTAKDLTSFSLLPGFVSEYDMNLTDTLRFDKKGIVVPGISRDYNNRKRSPRIPDIGSIEYEKQEFDVSLFEITNKKAIYGNNTFSVNILNDGNADLSTKSICLEYSIDSGKTWIGRQSVQLTELKNRYDQQKFSFNLKYQKNDFIVIPLCVRIAPDCRLANDTMYVYEELCKELCVGLEKGTYTIGKNGTEDFPTIQQAVVALVCGFDSSIVFNISPGNYYERVSIPALKTSSDTTVTFQSLTGNPNDVQLEYANTLDELEHHIVQLDGTRYITFKDLTFTSKAKARASGIHMSDTANNNLVEHCIFRFDSTAKINTLVGVLGSGKVAFTDPSNANRNTIKNCEFYGGGFGVRLLGSKTNAVSGANNIIHNKFRNVYTSAIDVFYSQIDSVSNNDIYMRDGNKDNVGLNIYGALTDFIITGNKIVNAQNIGLSIDSCRTISRGLIANNMIAGGFVSDNLKDEAGMLIKGTGAFPSKGVNSSGFIEIINNSILYDGNNDTAAALNILRSNSLNIYNNIIANYGTGYAFKFTASTDGVNEFNDADANLLYTRGPNVAKWNTTICPDIETLGLQNQGNSPFNVSKSPKGPNDTASFDPMFRSTKDLHVNYSYLDGSGFPKDIVVDDIDGSPRNPNTPDIGCDEFFPGFDLSLTEFVTPLNNATFKDEVQVIVKMKNLGSDIYSAKIKYSFDGVIIDSVIKNYPSPLTFDSTVVILFTKKFKTRQAGPHILAAYTEIKKTLPGGQVVNNDFNTLNDTIKITVISRDTSDIGVSNFLSPLNGLVVKDITPIQVAVTNYGNLTAQSFKLYLKVNGKIKETMNVSIPLLGKQTKEYQFNYAINPDSAVFFDICATTSLFDDVIESNDSNCIVTLTVGLIESSASKELFSVHPNPTNSKLRFGLDLPKEKEVEIQVYDLSGRLIRNDNVGFVQPGKQSIEMDYFDLAEGTYMFVLQAGDKRYNGRFVILR